MDGSGRNLNLFHFLAAHLADHFHPLFDLRDSSRIGRSIWLWREPPSILAPWLGSGTPLSICQRGNSGGLPPSLCHLQENIALAPRLGGLRPVRTFIRVLSVLLG